MDTVHHKITIYNKDKDKQDTNKYRGRCATHLDICQVASAIALPQCSQHLPHQCPLPHTLHYLICPYMPPQCNI